MAQVINTNVASLNSQRQLNKSQSALSTTLERLSSGLRINSAKDDAAGLAISDRMTSQINGLNQAVRNANDGISLAQTAEGGLSSVNDSLQRMRQLAVQSANSSNSASDRKAIDNEAKTLLAEISRVSSTTQFNGINLLDGTFTAAQFQVGANANQTILASTGNSQTSAIGSYQIASNTIAKVNGAALVSGDLSINGVDVGVSTSGSAESIAASINAVTVDTGVTASASSTLTSANALSRNQSLQSGDFVINGIDIGAVAGSNNLATQGANIAAAINAQTTLTGVSASANGGTGALTLTSATGKTIEITSNNAAAGGSRTENATGLEVSSGQSAATLDYTFTGTAGVSTNTFAAQVADGDSFILQGKTYEFDTGGSVGAGHIAITIGADLEATLDNTTAAVTANATNVTASNTATALSITSNYATSTTTHTAITVGNGAGNQTINNAATAGAGPAVGDTITVGQKTYEFGFASSTVTTGNTKVLLGATTATQTAQNFKNAVNAAYTATSTNVQAGGAAAVITLTSDNKGTQGTTDVTDATLPAGVSTGNALGGADGTYAALNGYGTLALNSASNFTITGDGLAKAGMANAQTTLSAISTIDLSTAEGANNAISIIDGALSQVDTMRADLGAAQNRFTSVVSNLTTSAENLSASRSRIQDADFAAETAAMSKNQILQQAGTAMLAQANSLPQQVLSLLK